MYMPKLVEGFSDALKVPAGKRDVLVFDDGHKDAIPGFGVRKFASGKASYIVKYSIGSKQRRQSLGPVTRGNLKAMRLLASEVKARARLGQDVIAERDIAAKIKAGAKTLASVYPKFLETKRATLKARSFAEVERHIKVAWKPLHKLPLGEITRPQIVSVIDSLESGNGKVAADRARISLSTLFAWAMDRGECSANPTNDIKARSEKVSRTRVLSESELVEIWNATLDDDYGLIVRLLLLTGQRRNEIGDLSRSEVNFSLSQIELPPERTKNSLPHIVPLAPQAVALLKGVKRRGDRELFFGRSVGGFSGWSKAKVELDERVAAARKGGGVKKRMAPWVLHDLRRTFVTHMNELGIAPPHIIEAVVNHVSGHLAGVAGVYNKAQYLDERRQALLAWSAHLAATRSRPAAKEE